MKKFFSFLILILILYLGATAWIGSRVEPYAQKYVQMINTRFGSRSGLHYRIRQIEHGFWTTTLQVDINLTHPLYAAWLNERNASFRSVTLEVEHGPLFFRHGPGAGLASVYAVQKLDDLAAPLGEAGVKLRSAKNRLHSLARIAFDRHVSMELRVDPFALVDQKNQMLSDFGSITLTTHLDPWKFVGEYHAAIPYVRFRPLSAAETPVQIEGLSLQGHMRQMLGPTLFLGEATLAAEHLQLKEKESHLDVDLAPRFFFGLQSDGNGTLNMDYDAAFRLRGGQFPDPLTPIRSARERLRIGGLSEEGLTKLYALIGRFQKKQIALYGAMIQAKNDPEALAKSLLKLQTFQQKMQEELLRAGARTLIAGKSDLRLHLKLATERNPENTFDVRLRLIKTLPQNDPVKIRRALTQKIPDYFSLDANSSMGIDFLREFGPMGIQYDAMLALAIKQGFVEKKEGRYVASLHYAPDKLIINHRNMPQLLMMIKMFSSGWFK